MGDSSITIEELKRRLASAEARASAAETALREGATRHRLLIESWAQAVWETDAAGVVVTDSPSWRAYTGQTLEEWLGYGWLDAIHSEDRAYAERQWRDAMAARRLVNAEFRLRAPQGGWRWTNVRAAPVLDEARKIEKWAGINIDIDDRKRAEVALRESEARYRNLFETMRQGYVENELIRDADGRAVDYRTRVANPQFERLTGVRVGEAVGRTARELVGELDPSWIETYERVVRTGQPEQFEREEPAFGRWFEVQAYPLAGDRFAILYDDITERRRIEAAARESEERQTFLLDFSDALRPIVDPQEVQVVATRLLGEQLEASRVFYVVIAKDGDTAFVHGDYIDGVPHRIGRYSLSAFSTYAVGEWRAGRVASTSDVNADDRYSAADRASYAAVSTRAGFGIPLIKEGRLVAILGVNQSTPRDWTARDIGLAGEVAERTWAAIERSLAEVALRESEERFQQFAKASSGAIWIRNAETLAMEYVSPAIETIYGVSQEAFLGDMQRWAAMIVPEDRDLALAHIEQARRGEPAVHEFRVQRPSDQAFRWIRNTDFPLYDAQGNIERVGGIAEDITKEKLAVEHQGVLLAELQHRVRNIMAILRSIAARTAHSAETVEEYAELIAGRLNTFARVQALLTRASNVGVGLAAIVNDELRALAAHAGQFEVEGPDIELSPKAAETITLAVHELTTNAVKYGALAAPDGKIDVRWNVVDRRGSHWVCFDWVESGAPAPPISAKPRRIGFGSELIEGRIPYELNGSGKVRIDEGGARCHLEFPLEEGASILETGAPQRAEVFGGAIDMTGQADLTGQRILVVEDDYYLASDTTRALQGAGAEVLGPCATEDDARLAIQDRPPTAAVLDINLRGGRSFDLAGDFKRDGVPFVFITGYDQEVVPERFEGVTRLQKPVEFRHVVGALADALGI